MYIQKVSIIHDKLCLECNLTITFQNSKSKITHDREFNMQSIKKVVDQVRYIYFEFVKYRVCN